MLPTTGSTRSTTPTPATYSTESLSSSYHDGSYGPHHRASLPLLQTRSAYPDYDSYGTSPPDEYSYSSSSLPRQPSYSSTYGIESFRPLTAGSVVAPLTSTSMYYEPGTAFSGSFGTLQAAPNYTHPTYPPTPTSRVSSASSEAFSPLNMASMHSSLPQQTVQERRLPMLPIPYTVTHAQPTYMIPEVPPIRPLGSFSEPRPHINGIYGRTGMPWSSDSHRGSSSSRIGSLSSLPLPRTDSAHPTSESTAPSYTSDPILGYQFSASTGSPTTSSTAGSTMSESFQGASSTSSSSMLPPTSRTRIPRGSSYPNLPSLTGGNADEYQQRSSSSSREAAASLYSFSTGVDPSDRAPSERHRHHRHHHNNNDDASRSEYRSSHHQHAAGIDDSRQRSCSDQQQQQQRSATSHRISVSSLNARS